MQTDSIRSHRDLIVWQRARELGRACLTVCVRLRGQFRYSVGDQIVRCVFSISGNIAEGRGRLSKADNVRHLTIARGSLAELESHLDLAVDLSFLLPEEVVRARELSDEVGRMLNVQIRRLGNRSLRGVSFKPASLIADR